MEDGPSRFTQGFTCPALLRYPLRKLPAFRLRGFHPLWPDFPCRSTIHAISDFPAAPQRGLKRPFNPGRKTPAGLIPTGLGSSHFARRYFGNRGFFIFLQVLRCFSSLGSPPAAMYSPPDPPTLLGGGCPIRRSPGHSLLTANRSFSQLTTSFIAS